MAHRLADKFIPILDQLTLELNTNFDLLQNYLSKMSEQKIVTNYNLEKGIKLDDIKVTFADDKPTQKEVIEEVRKWVRRGGSGREDESYEEVKQVKKMIDIPENIEFNNQKRNVQLEVKKSKDAIKEQSEDLAEIESVFILFRNYLKFLKEREEIVV